MKAYILCCVIFLLLNVNSTQAEEPSYTYENMMTDIQKVGDLFPEAVHIGSIGESEWGNDIPYLQIGSGSQHILVIGTHHAREWITSSFLMRLVDEYASLFEQEGFIENHSLQILDEVSLVIIPMLNPDGVKIQQTALKNDLPISTFKIWSMNHFNWNFKRWKANGLGVDLNRQYPADWEKIKRIPNWPSYKQYRGEKPVQAKEVKAVIQFTNHIKPLLALTYHTSGQEVYWYYHTKKEQIVRDYTLADKISQQTGYELAMPEKNATGGGYTDWFITTYGKPAFTIEMCTSVFETNPPLSCLKDEYERNKIVPLMLIHELLEMNSSL